MYRCRIVHSISALVDAKSQPATDLLAPAGDVLRSLFKHADDKYVRIIPAFAQRGVSKDELDRLLEVQQLHLPPQDQVVRIHVIRGPLR